MVSILLRFHNVSRYRDSFHGIIKTLERGEWYGIKRHPGRSGSGKTAHMLNEIITKVNLGVRKYYPHRPQQMSFQAEYAMPTIEGKTVSIYKCWVSNIGLSHLFEVGGANKQFISDRASS